MNGWVHEHQWKDSTALLYNNIYLLLNKGPIGADIFAPKSDPKCHILGIKPKKRYYTNVNI